jgi:hypothetical protein
MRHISAVEQVMRITVSTTMPTTAKTEAVKTVKSDGN